MVGIEHKIAQVKDMRGKPLYIGAKVVCYTRYCDMYANVGELTIKYVSGMDKHGEIHIVDRMTDSNGYSVWNPEKQLLIW